MEEGLKAMIIALWKVLNTHPDGFSSMKEGLKRLLSRNKTLHRWSETIYRHTLGQRSPQYLLYQRFKGNTLDVNKIDYVIVTHQKSGRTWLKFLLANYYHELYNMPFNVDLHIRRDAKAPTVFFTHDLKSIKKRKGKKMIYLIRNPRDVIVSYYYQLHFRMRYNSDRFFDGTMSEFLRDQTNGILALTNYMNTLFESKKHSSETLVLTYEDLHTSAEQQFISLLTFINVPVNKALVKKAIKKSSFKNMQKVEKNKEINDVRLQPSDDKNINTFKVRKGKVGGYKEELSKKDIAFIESTIEKNLNIPYYKK